MGIALKCNAFSKAASEAQDAALIELERRRRCWAGILSLHTYQTILFRDIDTRSLLGVPDMVNADDPGASAQLSIGTQVMRFKIRLFHLSSRICRNSSNHVVLDETAIDALDDEVATEQATWDAVFLDNGLPSVLGTTSYAQWCMLQVYAHQLYLLLHRPFCRARVADDTSPLQYRPSSRQRCITSGAALLDLHRRYVELPRLRHQRWTVYGMIGSCTVHGAMALASCLLEDHNDELDVAPYRQSFDAAVDRIGMLQSHSTIYVKAHPILRHIQ